MCKQILTLEAIKDITNQYYSQFCGLNISDAEQGIYFVCSEARDAILKGFNCKYTLYILLRNDLCIVSYSPKYKNYIDTLKGMSINQIISNVTAKFNLKKMQLMVFHGETVRQYGNTRILKETDYPQYEAFFRAAKPNASPDGWLYEYFTEKASKGYFTGYFSSGRLVSVVDAPDMPYMEDKIQHTGICTLKEERRKGYAKRTAALAVHNLIEKGTCPQWECAIDNIVSIELAKSIGYHKYMVSYILEGQ